ncbi:MAG TPA: hypothetical protein HPQ03_09970 [Deltaproteobacteria bacterium]|nr:hypothetical protein [Deltaproteobacteria bacterium]
MCVAQFHQSLVILVSPSGMVETPRLQAKKKTTIWPKAMSQTVVVQLKHKSIPFKKSLYSHRI